MMKPQHVTAKLVLFFFVFRQKINFEPKWHIPLIDLTLDDRVDVDGMSAI